MSKEVNNQKLYQFKVGEWACSYTKGWGILEKSCSPRYPLLLHGTTYTLEGRKLITDHYPELQNRTQRALLGDYPPKTKVKKTFWFNICKDRVHGYLTREAADTWGNLSDRIDCQQITIEVEE